MLSALLTTLQTSLGAFPKPFAMGSLMPITVFFAASAGMANELGDPLKGWALQLNPVAKPGEVAWTITAWVIVVFAVALLWSALNALLLELLEGKHLGWFGSWLYAGEAERLAALDRRLAWYQEASRELENPVAGKGPLAVQYDLKRALRDARRAAPAGKRHPSYPSRLDQRARTLLSNRHGAWPMARVRWRRRFGRSNTLQTLRPAVVALANELSQGMTDQLNQDHMDLVTAIDDARERLRFESQRLVNLRQFTYPRVSNAARGERTLAVLAPTRLGNVTRTIRSYALDRYGLDLEIFWTRLQRVAQAKDKSFQGLQDAKSQVDFLVSLFWLTLLFTAIWATVCLWVQPAPRAFLVVAAGGPIAARMLYLATVQNYVVFADLMRSGVDLGRFDLLEALQIKAPPGNREEMFIWTNLGGWMGYGNDTDVIYKEPKP